MTDPEFDQPAPLPQIDYVHAEYHTSWDWLMPVVEKISAIPLIGAIEIHDTCHPITFGMPDEKGNVMVRFKGHFIYAAPTLIEATWLAVVDFIVRQNHQITTAKQ
jgi:hypothetical protein